MNLASYHYSLSLEQVNTRVQTKYMCSYLRKCDCFSDHVICSMKQTNLFYFVLIFFGRAVNLISQAINEQACLVWVFFFI